MGGALLLLVALAIGAEGLTFNVNFLTDPLGPKALPLLVAGLFGLAGAGLLREARRAGGAESTEPASASPGLANTGSAEPALANTGSAEAGSASPTAPEVSPAGPPSLPRDAVRRMTSMLAVLLGYSFALTPLGFLIATPPAVAWMAQIFSARARQAWATGFTVAALLWALFTQLLALPLPTGDLWTR